MSRLQDKYIKEVKPKFKEELGIKNDLEIPRLQKIVINMGIGEAKDNQSVLDKAMLNLSGLSGQLAVVTRAKRSIANFKLSKGQTIGAMVSLRGERMYEFFDKLVSIVLPKVRDFRGVSEESFDQSGNYTLGLQEQLIFPEVNYKNIDKVRGMAISIITTAKDKQQGKRLLELLGMPFRKSLKGVVESK